jgi:hypothetical protein
VFPSNTTDRALLVDAFVLLVLLVDGEKETRKKRNGEVSSTHAHTAATMVLQMKTVIGKYLRGKDCPKRYWRDSTESYLAFVNATVG